MKKFYVVIEDSVGYEIEAKTEDEAIEKALGYWDEREPDVFVENEEEAE